MYNLHACIVPPAPSLKLWLWLSMPLWCNLVLMDTVGRDIKHPSKYTLLVDESGIDGRSKKLLYAGCIIETSALEGLHKAIVEFNQSMLDHPRSTGTESWVNSATEARHYTEDHFTLRERFVTEVVERVSCRVYVVMADFDASEELSGQKEVALRKLIDIATATRRAVSLDIVVEASVKEFDKRFPELRFENKSYLPLCIADYYAAFLNAFHEYRLGGGASQEESGVVMQFYRNVGAHIAFELDLSTGEKASRRNRYFLDKIK